jgi:hypothetical protein
LSNSVPPAPDSQGQILALPFRARDQFIRPAPAPTPIRDGTEGVRRIVCAGLPSGFLGPVGLSFVLYLRLLFLLFVAFFHGAALLYRKSNSAR